MLYNSLPLSQTHTHTNTHTTIHTHTQTTTQPHTYTHTHTHITHTHTHTHTQLNIACCFLLQCLIQGRWEEVLKVSKRVCVPNRLIRAASPQRKPHTHTHTHTHTLTHSHTHGLQRLCCSFCPHCFYCKRIR